MLTSIWLDSLLYPLMVSERKQPKFWYSVDFHKAEKVVVDFSLPGLTRKQMLKRVWMSGVQHTRLGEQNCGYCHIVVVVVDVASQ